MTVTYAPDYERYLVTDVGRLLGVVAQWGNATFVRDLDNGETSMFDTTEIDEALVSDWALFDGAQFDEARGVANAKQTEVEGMSYYIITHTGNVLAVTIEDELGIQYRSLITQQPGALSHDDVQRGINEQGWELLTDFLDAQIAAAANEDSFWEEGGGWI